MGIVNRDAVLGTLNSVPPDRQKKIKQLGAMLEELFNEPEGAVLFLLMSLKDEALDTAIQNVGNNLQEYKTRLRN